MEKVNHGLSSLVITVQPHANVLFNCQIVIGRHVGSAMYSANVLGVIVGLKRGPSTPHGNFDGNSVAYIGYNIYSNLSFVRPLFPIKLIYAADQTRCDSSANPR